MLLPTYSMLLIGLCASPLWAHYLHPHLVYPDEFYEVTDESDQPDAPEPLEEKVIDHTSFPVFWKPYELTPQEQNFEETARVELDKIMYEHHESRPFPEGYNSSTCSPECQAKAGNGICDIRCAGGCLKDLGDCKEDALCSNVTCPNDGKCRYNCELTGCTPGVCKLTRGKERMFVMVELPRVNPTLFMQKFEAVENLVNRELKGHYISLQGDRDGPLVWGFEGPNWALKRLRYEDGATKAMQKLKKYEPKQFHHRTRALFAVDGPIINKTQRDKYDVLERLGTNKLAAVVTPMILYKQQFWVFSEAYTSALRIELHNERRIRERKQRERKHRGRRAVDRDVFDE